MKLSRSISEQMFVTYVCLVGGVKPSDCGSAAARDILDDAPHTDEGVISGSTEPISKILLPTETTSTDPEKAIQVERSKALHELVTSGGKDEKRNSPPPLNKTASAEDIELEADNNYIPNANKLKLTKMKWLTENDENISDMSEDAADSSSSSSSFISSKESEGSLTRCVSSSDKCLSTILRLDKEHNMFGLSNVAIVGTKMSRKIRRENENPAFPQTAIIQVCCGRRCARGKSNTDLPASLKCSGCHSCCYEPYCCMVPRTLPCDEICPSQCSSCARIKCAHKVPCLASKCVQDCCNGRGGMKIVLNRKPKYEPTPIELTPRSSSVLQKPLAARSCHHTPQCVPPSSCCPYLLPCYWPARAGAPCSHPSRCFHNPPCRAPRKRKSRILLAEMCPTDGKCVQNAKIKCPNETCPGNNPTMKSAIESRFGQAAK